MDQDERNTLSRRRIVGGVGAGVALAAANPALAQQSGRPGTGQTAELAMDDPRSKYPKPPFKKQTQPWPGLARDMDPKPDHGERTYQGSGRLAGRKALITGGDSGMGRAAAIAYAREGADVAINYFPSEEPDAREVIQLIQAAGRKGISPPVICAATLSVGSWSAMQRTNSAASTFFCAMLGGSSRGIRSSM
jgi:hypothetical protein